MERISAFTDLCTPVGRFRYGTAAGGVPPTPVKAEWLNLVQEELCNFIRAYLPALDATDNTQLLKAVRALMLDYYTKPETDDLLDLKAPKDSPSLIGIPEAPTAAPGTSTKQIATTAFVHAVISALVNSAPATLDTLKEIADALGNDPNFAATIIAQLGLKATKVELATKQDKNTALMAVNGWKLDSATGLLEQWGTGSVAGDTTTGPLDFLVPFAEVYNCFGNKVTPNPIDEDGNSAGAFSISGTQYRLFNDTKGYSARVQWRAIGRAVDY